MRSVTLFPPNSPGLWSDSTACVSPLTALHPTHALGARPFSDAIPHRCMPPAAARARSKLLTHGAPVLALVTAGFAGLVHLQSGKLEVRVSLDGGGGRV